MDERHIRMHASCGNVHLSHLSRERPERLKKGGILILRKLRADIWSPAHL